MASAAERLSDGASEEKKIGQDHVENDRHTIENLPDPDAGLSDEERAAHVTRPFHPELYPHQFKNILLTLPLPRTAPSSANSTSNSSPGSPSSTSSGAAYSTPKPPFRQPTHIHPASSTAPTSATPKSTASRKISASATRNTT